MTTNRPDTAACGCNPAGPGPDNAWGDGPPYYDEDCPVHGRPEIIGRPATAAVELPGDVFDQMLTALREVRTFVHVETGHKPTVTELERVIPVGAAVVEADSVTDSTPATAAMVEWETFPLDPTWKGCGTCREDALGARVGIRPKVALLTLDWQLPEGIVVRVCSNCGHITTMGPIRPDIAAEWPVRNGR